MQIHITARHIELTTAIADYVQKRLERVARHFPAVIRVQVILSVEKHRHMAEIVAHANGHHDFRAKGESTDLYAAVDLVGEKLHKHMARQKDKRVRTRRRSKRPQVPDEALALAPLAPNEEPETLAPAVTQVKRFALKSMSVSEAVQEMEGAAYSFLVFMNDDAINVVYKRKDKTYGVLEPTF